MRCLLDTHVFIWMLSDEKKLSATASDIILNPNSILYFSMVSYWEICIKLSLEKLVLKRNWAQVFAREMRYNGIEWLPIKQEHARGVIKLPWHHRDPFDRLVVSQCHSEKLMCVTADNQIKKYNIKCLW